jgi:hypothetical protein
MTDNGDHTYAYVLSVPGSMDEGKYTAEVTATDEEGNSGTGIVTIAVDDPYFNLVDNSDGIHYCSLDHTDPEYQDWLVSTNYPGHYYGENVRYHRTKQGTDCTFTWVPDLPTAGMHEVYAQWTSNAYRADHVPYTIHYNGGSETVWADQYADYRDNGENGGDWVFLGTWDFAAGTGGSVVLNASNAYHALRDPPDNTPGGGYWVIADAVKFILIP